MCARLIRTLLLLLLLIVFSQCFMDLENLHNFKLNITNVDDLSKCEQECIEVLYYCYPFFITELEATVLSPLAISRPNLIPLLAKVEKLIEDNTFMYNLGLATCIQVVCRDVDQVYTWADTVIAGRGALHAFLEHIFS